MKTTFLALTVLAASVPMTLLADSPAAAAKQKAAKTKTVYLTETPKTLKKNTEYVFITRQAVTGSNIPMVVRAYNGAVTTTSNLRVYSRADLDSTGALDIGTDLYRRDPSFLVGRR